MPDRGWSTGGQRAASGPGRQEWQRFGRRMFARFIVFILLVAVGLIALGALLSVVLGSVDPGIAVIAVLLIIGIVGAIALVVSTFIRRTVMPIRGLISAAGEVADGDYSARAAPTPSAVIQPVVESFNDMAGRLEEADEQRRRLLADLGHELRTPLTIVRGEIEAMIDGVHAPDAEHLQLLLEEVTVMERLLSDLRTLSLTESGALALHPEPTDVSGVVSDVADTYRRVAAQSEVRVEVELDESLTDVWADPVRLREVVTNLLVNALNAMPDGGVATLRTESIGDDAVIEVADTGHGISESDLEHVFDRFHKGSTSGGSGLGLTISRDLARAHGGTLAIVRSNASGTLVRVTVPRSEPA